MLGELSILIDGKLVESVWRAYIYCTKENPINIFDEKRWSDMMKIIVILFDFLFVHVEFNKCGYINECSLPRILNNILGLVLFGIHFMVWPYCGKLVNSVLDFTDILLFNGVGNFYFPK